MATVPQAATIEDLYRVQQKAELVNGEIVYMAPTGDDPSLAAGEVYQSLAAYAKKYKTGRAYTDGTSFIVKLPHRESFSPDAAFYIGKRAGMKFLPNAPTFAVEVRSEGDYGPKAERVIADKRKDYFAAGTLAVWDVDLLNNVVVRLYLASNPEQPLCFQRGQIAHAEPAVPGWSMPVDDLFI
jgi:Uma2 family endonuclease